jgi:hypothetical protein
MTNVINNVNDAAGILAEAAAGMLSDNNQFLKSIAKVPKKEFDGKNGYKSGDTIQISKPTRFVEKTDGFDITSSGIQAINEETVPLVLDTTSNVSFDLDSIEIATKVGVESAIERFIKPAMTTISNGLEQRLLLKASQATYNLAGTAGSTVMDTDTVLSAREMQSKYLCPKDDDRFLLFNSTGMRSAVNARKGYFNPNKKIAEQYAMGYIGDADGYHWLENELLYVHTNGADVAAAVEATVLAPANGASTIGLDGVTSGATIKKGSTFTISGVYAVHPITKQAYPFLQRFTVTADVTETSGNSVVVAISPTIYTSASGALQNVSALHADEAPVVFDGLASTSYTQSLAFHKNAFRMASVPLVMPKNAEYAAQRTVDGLTVAIVRDWDQKTRSMITRLDVLCGLVADRPEWACRITS